MGADDGNQAAMQAKGTDRLGWLGLGWLDELRVIAVMLGLGLFVVLPLRHTLSTDAAPVPGFMTFALLALVQFALLRRKVRARPLSDRADFFPYAMGSALTLAPAALGVDKGASGVALWLVVLLAWLAALRSGRVPAPPAPGPALSPRAAWPWWLKPGLAGPPVALVAALVVAWGAQILSKLVAVPMPRPDADLGEIAEVVPPAMRPHATHVWRRAHQGYGELIPDVVQVRFRLPVAEASAWQAALALDGRREVRRPDLLGALASPEALGYELLRRRRVRVRVPGEGGLGVGYATTIEGAFDLATGDVIVESARAMNPVALPPGTRAGEGTWVDLPATPDALPSSLRGPGGGSVRPEVRASGAP